MAARHLELIICQSLEIPINLQSFDNIFIDLKMLYVLVDLVFIFYFFFNLQKICFVNGIRTLLPFFFATFVKWARPYKFNPPVFFTPFVPR